MSREPAPSVEPANELHDLPRNLRRGIFKILAWTALVALVALIWWRQADDAMTAQQALRDAHSLPLVGGCLLLMICLAWPSGQRWRALLPREEGRALPSSSAMTSIAALQILLGLAVPGPLAELVSADLIKRSSGIRRSRALAASLHARLVGLIVALLHTAAIWLIFPVAIFPGFEKALFGSCVIIAIITLMLLAIIRWPDALRLRLESWLAVLPRKPRFLRRGLSYIANGLDALLQACAGLGRRFGRPHLKAAGWSSLSYGLGGIGAWWIAVGIGAGGDPIGILFAYNGVGAAVIVLFFLPAAYVSQDAALCGLLVAAGGLTLEAALLVAVVVRLAATVGLVIALWGLRGVIRGGLDSADGHLT